MTSGFCAAILSLTIWFSSVWVAASLGTAAAVLMTCGGPFSSAEEWEDEADDVGDAVSSVRSGLLVVLVFLSTVSGFVVVIVTFVLEMFAEEVLLTFGVDIGHLFLNIRKFLDLFVVSLNVLVSIL